MARVGTSPKLENTLRYQIFLHASPERFFFFHAFQLNQIFYRLNGAFSRTVITRKIIFILQYIEMVEIDGVVMRECAKHMRATAGDSMDNYTGDNYQIFCEDCIPR